MRNLLKGRFALSTVVTTLIILVVSVLLAGVVAYFSINVSSTRVQEESLVLTKLHVWVPQDNPTDTEAALIVINTGGRDVVISKIAIRGQAASIPPSNNGLKDVCYAVTNNSITNSLSYILAVSTGGDVVQIDKVSAHDVRLAIATQAITLQSGYSMIIYVAQPYGILLNDIGTTAGIMIFTSQAMYYHECNIETYLP